MTKQAKLYYLASPYTHTNKKTRELRFNKVTKASIWLLLKKNIVSFSPIAYNHPMVKYELPTDWAFWKKYDTNFLQHSDGLIVFTLDGWKDSIGVQAEINIAKKLKLPIFYLSEDDIEKDSLPKGLH